MAKIIFFILIVFIIVFPVFISNTKYKTFLKKAENKPLIEIFEGKYKKYNKILEINGSFSKAGIFKNSYQFFNLYANDLVKKEYYFAKWALKKDNIIKAKRVKYINDDYLINSENIIYYENKKFLKGWDFNFSSVKAKGRGDYFEVDKNKNLFAKNVVYFIKVEK
jgi:hypothetical protein